MPAGKRLVQSLCLAKRRTCHLRDLADLKMTLFNASRATLERTVHTLPRSLKRVRRLLVSFATYYNEMLGLMSRLARTHPHALDRADRRGCGPSNPWRPTSSVRSNLDFRKRQGFLSKLSSVARPDNHAPFFGCGIADVK